MTAAVGLLAGASLTIAACSPTGDQRVAVQEPTTLPTSAPLATVPTTAAPSTSATAGNTGAVDSGAAAGAPCTLGNRGPSETVPIDQVCSSAGVPHFDTPQAAMSYLADAWNTGDVQQIDYVTDPVGRAQLDAMASVMVNLRFDHCTENPAGDYTCYFMHDVMPSTSPTTYPNPMNYPPGEAVFTVAPAATPGWYLTAVIHCG